MHPDADAANGFARDDIIRDMWQAAGSEASTMDPFQHDRILGAVSHLPHIAAFALVNTLLELEPSTQPGLISCRLAVEDCAIPPVFAASSPEMWRDILLWNCDNLVTMIVTITETVASTVGNN